MGLRILDTVCEPGGGKPNEDRLGFVSDAAWVIDGATDLQAEPFLPAFNDVHYLVDAVDKGLADAVRASADVDSVLTELSASVGWEIQQLSFPADRVQPTCSLGLVVDHGDTVELVRIADTTLVAVGPGAGSDTGVRELSTTFFDQREMDALSVAGSGGLDSRDVREAMLRRRREYMTGVHPEGVFSADPAAVLRIHRARLDWREVRHVLVCSDGFARAITDYGLYPGWAELVDAAVRDSLAAVAKAIRAVERGPDAGATRRHFKRSDDLAAVLCAKD